MVIDFDEYGFDSDPVDPSIDEDLIVDEEPEQTTADISGFAVDIKDKRVAVLCTLAPKPILLDVVWVDTKMRMLKVKTVLPVGSPETARKWWLALEAIITVAVVPKADENLVKIAESNIVIPSFER